MGIKMLEHALGFSGLGFRLPAKDGQRSTDASCVHLYMYICKCQRMYGAAAYANMHLYATPEDYLTASLLY